MSQSVSESAELLPLERHQTQSTISAFSATGAERNVTAELNPHVLYEDSDLQVSQEGLTIKRYYFPIPMSKFIPWGKIETVQTASEANVQWYELKMWGMGFGNIWWAQKFRIINDQRNGQLRVNTLPDIMGANIVIKIRGQWVRPGCHVEYAQEAIRAIRRMLARTHQHAE